MATNRNKLTRVLIALCAGVWIVAAIDPLDRQAWLLENLLLIVFAGILGLTPRRLDLSSASRVCIAFFVILHIVGTHYTYEQMPLGIWARDAFHLTRNPYDRVAHGAFGFLLVFPVRELLLRFADVMKSAGYWLPPAVILAISGLFEILESVVAEMVAPGEGVNWLGGQGDEWDAQNDMLASFVGAVIMMSIAALISSKKIRQ